jgi:hypothetical protein
MAIENSIEIFAVMTMTGAFTGFFFSLVIYYVDR